MRGALAVLNTTQLVENSYYAGIWKYLQFQEVQYDTDGFFDLVNHPDRLTIPSGLNGKIGIIKISVRWESGKQGKLVQILPTRFVAATNSDNLSGYAACAPDNRPYIFSTTTDHDSATHPDILAAGNYYRAAAWQQQATGVPYNLGVMAGTFSIQILD